MIKKDRKQVIRKRRRRQKVLTVVLSLVLFAGILTAGTIAYLQQEAKLSNTFTVGQVQAEVNERFVNNVKSDVSIENKGNVDAYIRAKILIYFVDRDGNPTGEVPVEGTDYTMSMGESIDSNWIKSASGYYYYKNAVAPGQKTDLLIKECKRMENLPVYKDGNRRLVVDIVGEAIQANESAVQDAWGKDVQVENGTLKSGNI